MRQDQLPGCLSGEQPLEFAGLRSLVREKRTAFPQKVLKTHFRKRGAWTVVLVFERTLTARNPVVFVSGSRPAQQYQWSMAFRTAIAGLVLILEWIPPVRKPIATGKGNLLLTQQTGTSREKAYLSEDCSQVI